MKIIDRILIVGTGSAGKRHLNLANELFPTADIKVLKLGRPTNDLDDAEKTFTTLEEALKFDPVIAVIANPSPLHMEVAIPLASKGVHLLIEKPISNSSKQVSELIQICEENNLTLMTGYNLRYSPSLVSFRKLLLDSHAGEIFSVRIEVGQFLPSWRPDMDYQYSVTAQKDLGGGVILELSHEIDYLRWIFGEIQWVSGILVRQSNLDIDVEDCAHLSLATVPKANKQVLISANLDFIRHDKTRSCIAICENGSLKWDGIAGDVSFMEPGSQTWQVIFSEKFPNDYTYRQEWADFINCIINNETPVVTGLDGLKSLEIIEAISESSKLGKIVIVSPLLSESYANK
jgi:predicted dehydrogenase